MNHVLMLLDQSGSMESIRDEAINHFNEQVQTIRKSAAKAAIPVDISLVCFNDEAHVVHWREPVESLPDLKGDRYKPNAITTSRRNARCAG